jgi:hypothetical protein
MSVDSDLDHLADEVSVDSLHFSHFPTMVIWRKPLGIAHIEGRESFSFN